MEISKNIILIGISITCIGVFLFFLSKIPWFGNLFGDVNYENKNLRVYFPITSMIVISFIISIVLNIFYRIFK